MHLSFPCRICKVLSIYYFLIWINLLDGKPLANIPQNNRNLTNCVPEFETNVQHCVDGLYFYEWKMDVLKFKTSQNVFKEILKRFFCRQYTNSLQCIHEILDSCKTEETTRTVQTYLSQPWARQYNTLCDINQQNSSFVSKSNSTVTRENLNRERLNGTVMQYTENNIIKPSENSNSEIKRQPVSHKKPVNSVINDNQHKNGELSSEQFANPTGNTKEKFSKNTLFYSKSTKTENTIKGKQKETVKYRLLFQKLVSKKMTSSMQSIVTDNENYKPSESNFEILMEIQ